MLNQHLIVKTRPVAHKENIATWRNYRVTVLADRLFRLEYSENNRYRDGATQSVFFRDHAPQTYSVTEENNACIIDTGACALVLAPTLEKCYIRLDGKEVALDNADNLLGTYRTLDGCDGDFCIFEKGYKIKLGVGVCSRSGVAVIDDSASLTLGEDGMVTRQRADGFDGYIFAYGTRYRDAVKALYSVTGNTPMLPRYALGNWWSRYYRYTDKEYLRVMDKFFERDIPLTVATVDMDWHYAVEDMQADIFGAEKAGKKGGIYGTQTGWTGYTWNKTLFPDYKAFLQKLQARGLHVTLNLHPAEGVAFWEERYKEMANAVGVNSSTCQCVAFDITSPDFVNAYFKVLHRPYEKEGVDFWWMDWQQGTSSAIEGLDPLWALNHFHYLDHVDGHNNGLILSRYSGVGAHRYPVGFSGDSFITWETLDYLPYFTATASNIGYTWWSHDIGGHQWGEMNEELYLRHVQYGVFSPINRLHCTSTDTIRKEPWLYGGAGRIAEEFLRLRHALIPYLYTEAYRTHKEGLALVQPLYYEWQDKGAYKYDREYLFGASLLVVPVTKPAEADGYVRVNAWLPEGKWTDIFTGFVYEIGKGGRELVLTRTKDEMPVFARAGAILPLSADKGNGVDAPEQLELRTYTGDGEYTLYEDGAFTEIKQTAGAGTCSLHISARGDKTQIPVSRTVLIRFENIDEGEVHVFADGVELKTEELYKDCVAVRFAFERDKTYEIKVRYKEKTEDEKRIAHAEKVLVRAEGDNREKWTLFEQIRKDAHPEEYAKAVYTANVSEGVKLRLKEIF